MLVRTMQELESQGRIVSISHRKSTAVRLLTKADGLTFSISEAREPGVLYCVGPKDKHHVIRDDTRLRIISVFNQGVLCHLRSFGRGPGGFLDDMGRYSVAGSAGGRDECGRSPLVRDGGPHDYPRAVGAGDASIG